MGQIYKGNQLILEWWWWVTPITVDSALSTTSENPVQNKVITQALEEWLVTHSATEPATPEDWMLWYDETNKVLKIYSETDTEWKELWEWWVTSINGNTGDITMSTGKITLTQNWVEAGHFFLDQTVDKTIELKGYTHTFNINNKDNIKIKVNKINKYKTSIEKDEFTFIIKNKHNVKIKKENKFSINIDKKYIPMILSIFTISIVIIIIIVIKIKDKK